MTKRLFILDYLCKIKKEGMKQTEKISTSTFFSQTFEFFFLALSINYTCGASLPRSGRHVLTDFSIVYIVSKQRSKSLNT